MLPSQAIFTGSSPNITCVAEFDNSVDLPLNMNITFTVDGKPIYSGHSVHMESYMHYTRTFTVENVQAFQAGICSFSSSYELSAFILEHQMDPIYANVNISISKLTKDNN